MVATLWSSDLSYTVVVFQDMADSFSALEVRDGNNTDGGRGGETECTFQPQSRQERLLQLLQTSQTKRHTGDLKRNMFN